MNKLLFFILALSVAPVVSVPAQDLTKKHVRDIHSSEQLNRNVVLEERTHTDHLPWLESGRFKPHTFSIRQESSRENNQSINGVVLQSRITQSWDPDSSAWVNYSLKTCSYDSLGNLTTSLYQLWDGSGWVNDFLSTWTMDEHGHIATWLYQSWDWWYGIRHSWMNYQLTTYSYGQNGKEESELLQNWSDTGWVNEGMNYYLYDTNGFNSSLLIQSWGSGEWMNSYRYTTGYDSSGYYATSLGESWDGNSWVNAELYTYSHDPKWHDTAVIAQYWNDTVWVKSWMYTYSYDEKGYDTSLLDQGWADSIWVNSWCYTMLYDANGNETQSLLREWDGSTWVNSYRQVSTWGPMTAAQDSRLLPLRYLLSPNYPNPFNPSTQIRFTLPKATDVTLKIFNVLGEEVATLVAGREEPGEHAVVWDASKMPSGVYFYRLSAGGFLQTKKMVLMK